MAVAEIPMASLKTALDLYYAEERGQQRQARAALPGEHGA